MNGLTEQEIIDARKYWVDVLESQGHEVVDNLFKDVPNVKNVPLGYLAASLKLISESDAVLFIGQWKEARGCVIEHECCVQYDVKIFYETHFQQEI